MPAYKKIFINLSRRKECINEINKLNRDDSDLTITIQLKAPAEKIMRLHITGYYEDECLYSMTREEFIMNYKEYRVNKQKHAIS